MNITEHIKSNDLSREEICANAGISRAHLSLIECGKRKVGPVKVCQLAKALGVTVRHLRPDLADVFGAAA